MSAHLPRPAAPVEDSELTGNKGMALKVDLSGLTPYEIAKIQQVMLRANQASKLINEQASKIKENFESLKLQVQSAQNAVVSTSHKPNQKRSLCEICFRVDLNVTFCHCCTSCQRKFCSRCGHRTTTSFQASSPSQWLCSLCFHERKYLSISGAWVSKAQANDKNPLQRRLTAARRHTLSNLFGNNKDRLEATPASKPLSYGDIEVQFGYVAGQSSLVFTIICAHDLQYRDGRDKKSHINPYCKVYLLPNRQDKRRTSTLTDTTDPVWNRSFMYENVTSKMLKLCSLEISVWSHRGHMRSRKFLGQVTIPLSSVQFDNRPCCFHLEYPDSSCQLSPPSPAPSRISLSSHEKQDSTITSTPAQHFSYSKMDIMKNKRHSVTSYDSGDSGEEELCRIYASRSYDTGLDELGVSHSHRALGMETNDSAVPDLQSVTSHYDEQPSDSASMKTSHSNPQLKPFTLAKKILTKRDNVEEDADVLVAEYFKQKAKEEEKLQTKEQQVGKIIRATQSRTSSPTPQFTSSQSRPGRSTSLTSPIPSVEIAECRSHEMTSKESSISSLLYVEQTDAARRHSSPNIHPPTIQALRALSPVLPKARSHCAETLPAHFRDILHLSPIPGVRLANSGSSDDDTSMISTTCADVMSATAGRSMLGLGVGQLLRSNHIGSNATGRIHLGFSMQRNQINVHVVAAADLSYCPDDVAADRIAAPYVKLYLLDGRKPMVGEKEKRTKEAATYTNPSFNDIITFHCSDLLKKTLKVKVKYEPRRAFRRQSKEIGQALVSLDSLDLCNELIMEWYKLFPAQ